MSVSRTFSLWMVLVVAMCTAFSCTEVDPSSMRQIERQRAVQAVVTAPPEIERKVNAKLGDTLELLGYDLEPDVLKAGENYTATFYFKALTKPRRDWMFFGHLESTARPMVRAKLDHEIAMATSSWEPGQIVKSVFHGTIPAEFPGKQGLLYVGFWVFDENQGDSGIRLGPIEPASLNDGQNRVKAGRISFKVDEENQRRQAARHQAIVPGPYTIKRTEEPITIDGELKEEAWKHAPFTPVFVTPSGGAHRGPKTQAKLLWDDKNLYVAFHCQDLGIWSPHTEKDHHLWKAEAVEVMIDADANGKVYFEIQVAPNNVQFDTFFGGAARQDEDRAWSADFQSAVAVIGTLNEHDDRDKEWFVEIAIPYSAVKNAPNLPPKNEDKWRLNLFRVNSDRPGERTWGSMWSPVTPGDWHILEKWGTVVFTDQLAKAAQPEPEEEQKVRIQPVQESEIGGNIIRPNSVHPRMVAQPRIHRVAPCRNCPHARGQPCPKAENCPHREEGKPCPENCEHRAQEGGCQHAQQGNCPHHAAHQQQAEEKPEPAVQPQGTETNENQGEEL